MAITTLLGGLTAGVILGRMLDPVRGRRRRAMARDQAVSVAHAVGDAVSVTARDARHRSRGVIATLRSRLAGDDAPEDAVLAERVRAVIGGAVGHPRAIEVDAHGGRVTLRGPVLAHEVSSLMRRVGAVRGVREIEDALEVHTEPADVPALQGAPRQGGAGRFELWQEHWSPTARTLVGLAGAGAALAGVRRGGATGSLLTVAGAAALARGLTNISLRRLLGLDAGRGTIVVQKTVHVAAPVETVFDVWTRYEDFPEFMRNVRAVERLDGARARWTVAGPGGVPVRYETRETERRPPGLIAWETVEGAPVPHTGRVRFDAEEGGTRIHVQMTYTPPLGAAGHAVAWLLGADPRQAMHEDLVRLKSLLENGKTSVGRRTVTLEDVHHSPASGMRNRAWKEGRSS
jgi:uncharacterized membrane protein